MDKARRIQSVRSRVRQVYSSFGFKKNRLLTRRGVGLEQVIMVETRHAALRVQVAVKLDDVPNIGEDPEEETFYHIIGIVGGGVGPCELDPQELTDRFLAEKDFAVVWAKQSYHEAISPFFNRFHDRQQTLDIVRQYGGELEGILVLRNLRAYLGLYEPGCWSFSFQDSGEPEV